MATDQTAADPPSVGKTIFENIGSMQKNRAADRKIATEYIDTGSSALRAGDAGRDRSKTVMVLPFEAASTLDLPG
jgi:hypothetical protein